MIIDNGRKSAWYVLGIVQDRLIANPSFIALQGTDHMLHWDCLPDQCWLLLFSAVHLKRRYQDARIYHPGWRVVIIGSQEDD